ncbi:hypothetical protein DAETH_16680 [Deinococcus aetherius]|uniref:Uncharacterized protein n=1 Tax=Deinococcus aetherius TaxID=200252 RepID=A0ABM8AD82_9DEIO|nr:hypothetical protein [Deinococcus aetherius]BDP41699.1 hypothetical protein DAETH_16680 [Deinococcus aetherius]
MQESLNLFLSVLSALCLIVAALSGIQALRRRPGAGRRAGLALAAYFVTGALAYLTSPPQDQVRLKTRQPQTTPDQPGR